MSPDRRGSMALAPRGWCSRRSSGGDRGERAASALPVAQRWGRLARWHLDWFVPVIDLRVTGSERAASALPRSSRPRALGPPCSVTGNARERGLISRALRTGASINHGTFTAGSGAVGSNSIRCDGGEATAQMDNIAAIMIVIPRIIHCSPRKCFVSLKQFLRAVDRDCSRLARRQSCAGETTPSQPASNSTGSSVTAVNSVESSKEIAARFSHSTKANSVTQLERYYL